MTLRRRLYRWVRNFRVRFLHWRYCSICRTFSKIRWVKDPVYHPEEPPMFYHYECARCGTQTSTQPTSLTEDACQSLGYSSFSDYAAKNLSKKMKRDDG